MAVRAEELKVGQVVKAILDCTSAGEAVMACLKIDYIMRNFVGGTWLMENGTPRKCRRYTSLVVHTDDILAIVHQPEEVS